MVKTWRELSSEEVAPTKAEPQVAGETTTFAGTPGRMTFPRTVRHCSLTIGVAESVISFPLFYTNTRKLSRFVEKLSGFCCREDFKAEILVVESDGSLSLIAVVYITRRTLSRGSTLTAIHVITDS